MFTPHCNAETAPTAVFPILAGPDSYIACKWDLTNAPDRRGYWLQLFRDHFPKCMQEAEKEAETAGRDLSDLQQRAEVAQAEFYAYLDYLTETPNAFGRLDTLAICYQRERVFRRHGFEDPYRVAKRIENDQALSVLPKLLTELDDLDEAARSLALIEGIFAGNIFDLGASKTIDMFRHERVNFHETRGLLRPKPWYIDDFDAWRERLAGPPHRAAVLFLDNAGPDVILGMLPFSRELLRRGTRVILTANTYPSLNDITHDELRAVIAKVSDFDDTIRQAQADGRLRLIASGNWAPLIDLTRVSPELAQAAGEEPVDLVVLEGMGRAVESNLDASLQCDCIKIAMIKDQGVVDTLSEEFELCRLFDLVMKFEPGMQ